MKMKVYAMGSEDMRKGFQSFAEYMATHHPTQDAPGGFSWFPIVVLHEDEQPPTVTVQWTAKPNE